MQADDSYWRRPDRGAAGRGLGGAEPDGPEPPTEPAGTQASAASRHPTPGYAGPPSTTAPPLGWQPPHLVEPPPPRPLPAQDHRQIDEEEARARRFTLGLGIVVAALLLIMLCTLCGRVLW